MTTDDNRTMSHVSLVHIKITEVDVTAKVRFVRDFSYISDAAAPLRPRPNLNFTNRRVKVKRRGCDSGFSAPDRAQTRINKSVSLATKMAPRSRVSAHSLSLFSSFSF